MKSFSLQIRVFVFSIECFVKLHVIRRTKSFIFFMSVNYCCSLRTMGFILAKFALHEKQLNAPGFFVQEMFLTRIIAIPDKKTPFTNSLPLQYFPGGAGKHCN